MIPDRVRRLLARPDLRRGPVGGLVRRLYRHLRWRLTSRPLLLRLRGGLRMYVGNGALLFYQGRSEPETAAFLERVLKPGMVFYDVGAHLGEYTLLAASRVGAEGRVHAFEPDPALFSLLSRNVALNRLGNVEANRCAVSDREGEREFFVRDEPSISSLCYGDRVVRQVRAPTVALETYARRKAAEARGSASEESFGASPAGCGRMTSCGIV